MITHDQTRAAIPPTPCSTTSDISCMIKGAPEIYFFHPSCPAAGEVTGQRVKGSPYPADFHQLGEHDNTEAVLLPDHPPEVVDHVLLGACGGGDIQ